MVLSTAAPRPATAEAAAPWTCPFCALHCDAFQPVVQGERYVLEGSDCPRAHAGLAQFAVTAPPQTVQAASVNGQAVPLSQALDAAAAALSAAQLPLLGGLATDITGSRALYRLANACHAIADHAHGDAQMRSVRALQDRGLLTTTLAEVRERADLIVCLGTPVTERYPEFFRRCGLHDDVPVGTPREVFFVGAPADRALRARANMHVRELPLCRENLFDTVATLAALVAQRPLSQPAPDALAALAQRLNSARYAVLVLDLPALPPHGELILQAVHRLVDGLNRSSRAAALLLGGSDGALSANQTFTWMSGLPLRTGMLARGLVHEPVAFATERLLQQEAVDALVWVASFGAQLAPPSAGVPRIVLGHPALASQCKGARDVFIAVATPGIGCGGHVSRFDSVVVLPLRPLRDDGLPSVAQVADALAQRMAALKPR